MTKINKSINNIIAAILKQSDAPCSASTHLNTAIVDLLSLSQDWTAPDKDFQEVVDFAIEEIDSYRKLGYKG